MQHQCHYIPTPTRLDKQVAGLGTIYATPMPQGFIQKFWLGVGEIKCMLGGGGGGGGGGFSVTFPVKKKSISNEDCY